MTGWDPTTKAELTNPICDCSLGRPMFDGALCALWRTESGKRENRRIFLLIYRTGCSILPNELKVLLSNPMRHSLLVNEPYSQGKLATPLQPLFVVRTILEQILISYCWPIGWISLCERLGFGCDVLSRAASSALVRDRARARKVSRCLDLCILFFRWPASFGK